MRQSNFFTKARREAPADEVAGNAQLLVRAGYIHKEMAGVYDYLPLGLRTLEKIIDIIREEMNAIGGQEVLFSALQNPELWKKERPLGRPVRRCLVQVSAQERYRDRLRLAEHTKSRSPRSWLNMFLRIRTCRAPSTNSRTSSSNETRAKSGIMRTREFIMKDLVSVCETESRTRGVL